MLACGALEAAPVELACKGAQVGDDGARQETRVGVWLKGAFPDRVKVASNAMAVRAHGIEYWGISQFFNLKMGQWAQCPVESSGVSRSSICFLVDPGAESHNDNHVRLPRAFESFGWHSVSERQHDLSLEGGRACIRRGAQAIALDTFGLVWHLGLGSRPGFLDRMELLSLLPQGKMVTPPSALALRHGKLHLSDPLLRGMLPETYASADVNYLLSVIDEREWIIKPSAASFGRGVRRVRAGMPDLRETLRLTAAGGMLVLQRHVQAESPETRVLFAEGAVVASYGRQQRHRDASNLAQGAKAVKQEIGAEVAQLALQVGDWLRREGIGFAAADFRAGHLIEINIANPGGLATVQALTGRDAAIEVASLLARRHEAPPSAGGFPG